jgi:hypothetical protein
MSATFAEHDINKHGYDDIQGTEKGNTTDLHEVLPHGSENWVNSINFMSLSQENSELDLLLKPGKGRPLQLDQHDITLELQPR